MATGLDGICLDGTRLDTTHLDTTLLDGMIENPPYGKNREPTLTAPASMVRSTSMTFSDKLTFPDEPTSDEPTSNEPTSSSSSSTSRSAASTSTIKREEKEKPRHSDSGQELDDEQDLDSKYKGGISGRSWMMGRSRRTAGLGVQAGTG